MSALYLIRHGQASFGKNDYDHLSQTGFQQAKWLGEYFAEMAINPSQIISGGLVRHRQTVEAIQEGMNISENIHLDERWNEFDFEAIARAYLTMRPEEIPREQNVKAFFSVLRNALNAWSNDEIKAPLPESWNDFEYRIKNALVDARENPDNPDDKKNSIFIISSGGAISMALKQLMGFDNQTMIDLNLQSRNTGLSECYFNTDKCYVTSFNTIPHLQQKYRKEFITSA